MADKTFRELTEIFNRLNASVIAIPQRVAVLAVNFSKERFIQKNWHDTTTEPWPKTKKKTGSTLVASGRLKQSIRKICVTSDSVAIGTNVPYAQMHNDGGEISGIENVRSHHRRTHKRKAYTRKGKNIKSQTVRGYQVKQYSRKYHRKFKARQFIGKSQELTNRIENLIKSEMDKAIQGK